MEITQIYAIVAGGVFLLLMFMKGFPFIQQVLQSLNTTISRYLTYPLIVRRHRLLGPWSPARSASTFVYFTQRLLRHLSRDFLRRSGRQGRNSFDNQHGTAFLWSSLELLSRFVGSITVQLPTDPSLRGDDVFRTRRAAYIRRCPSRPYVLFTRAREPLFAHRKSHGHFRRHFTHRLAGYICS